MSQHLPITPLEPWRTMAEARLGEPVYAAALVDRCGPARHMGGLPDRYVVAVTAGRVHALEHRTTGTGAFFGTLGRALGSWDRGAVVAL
jgi:hypothetical protein